MLDLEEAIDCGLEHVSPGRPAARDLAPYGERFVAFDQVTYAVKPMPVKAAHRDYETRQRLDELAGAAVRPVGLVVRAGQDTAGELGAGRITR